MSLSKPNNDNQAITLATYEAGVLNYVHDTAKEVTGEFATYIQKFLSYIPTTAAILEVGSGTGRDADYIESFGYTVTRTDVVEGFLELQRTQGKTTQRFDVLSDDLEKQFDLVIAHAVFLHFTAEQFSAAVRNVRKHLKPDGYFALVMKQGAGEEYSTHKMNSPRFFKYWEAAELKKQLESEGFSIVHFEASETYKWLRYIVKKID